MSAAGSSFKDKRVTVAGLGQFGGGVGVTRWLVGQAARVLVTDVLPKEKLKDSLAEISGLPVEFRLGEHLESDFTSADIVVTSPAVKPSNPFLLAADRSGVPITTEIAIFASRCPARVLGVTGTKGKSTTSSLLYRILHDANPRTLLGGNIGGSLLGKLDTIDQNDLVVLELSSFMLYWLGKDSWSPHLAVLTMLGEDHLDWHGTIKDYHAAKMNIFANQTADDFAVVPAKTASSGNARRVDFAPEGKDIALRLPGPHNRNNARAAIAAAECVGIDRASTVRSIADFAGLPHRLEVVHEHASVQWINDSIATNPAALMVALSSFEAGRIIAIVGGRTKGLDDSAAWVELASRARVVLTIGEVADHAAESVRDAGGIAEVCDTLDVAVRQAHHLARPGDVVLLSPGYTSYDQFDNFQQRGHAFTTLARSISPSA